MSNQSPSSNPATRWSSIFVNALAHSGLQSVCIAPGSRSTPLTLAFDAHPAVNVYLHLDERSAAFFALGMALAADRPVAIVCTSGTAVANFLPAIVEARQSQVPLLILTADRPPELRHSGANQTIDQVKIYGDQVLWSVDAALPETDGPDIALRNLSTLAARAYGVANGLVKGPVHINFPFRKPLEPPLTSREEVGDPDAGQVLIPAIQPSTTEFVRGVMTPTEEQLAHLTDIIDRYERGLIICGPRCPEADFPQVVTALSATSSYPVLADPLSGLRFGKYVGSACIIGGYDTFLMNREPSWAEPEVIIRFGAVPTSKWLNEYLDRRRSVHRIHIRANGIWADDSHRTTHFLQADEATTCSQLARRIRKRVESSWQEEIWKTEVRFWSKMDEALTGEYFDGAIVADVVEGLPAGAKLFMGNSLPIRHLDQFGRPLNKSLRVFANRGASGIDGNISTALGAGIKDDMPLVLVVGDITFYHDLNGLLAVKQHGLRRVTVVLLNNNGGSIFHRLPVARFDPSFTKLFLTPHGLDFEPAVRMYGLDYIRAEGRQHFRQLFAESVAGVTPRVIEVRTDGQHDLERRQVISNIVNGGS